MFFAHKDIFSIASSILPYRLMLLKLCIAYKEYSSRYFMFCTYSLHPLQIEHTEKKGIQKWGKMFNVTRRRTKYSISAEWS
jgi:hypothetical protein